MWHIWKHKFPTSSKPITFALSEELNAKKLSTATTTVGQFGEGQYSRDGCMYVGVADQDIVDPDGYGIVDL